MDQEPENFEPSSIGCGDYRNTLSNIRALNNILNSKPNSEEFTTFAYCVARDIKKLRNTQSTINYMSNSGEYEGFLKELICFLKDIGYTHLRFTTDTISVQLESRRGRLLLIECLISDLLAARIEHMPCLKNNYIPQQGLATDLSPFFVDLSNVLLSLKLKETPPNITPKMFYLMIEYELISLGHEKLLRMNSLSSKKYRSQDKGFRYIYAEYKNLRKVLASRLHAMGPVRQGGPPNPKNDRVTSGLSYFEESVIMSQRYEITQYLADLATLLELRTNFVMNENKQNAEATLEQETQKSQPKVFVTPRVGHKVYGKKKKNQCVNQNKSRYDMDAPGCSGTQNCHRQNEGGAGLDDRFSNLNLRMINNPSRNMNRDSDGFTAGHQTNEPFISDPSTSQGNDSAPLIDPASSTGRGRGGYRRGSLWSRYVNYVGREDYGYCYEERRFMEISEPTLGNRVFRGGVRGRGVPGRGVPYNALQRNGFVSQQLPPHVYLRSSQMLLFTWNYTFVFATYDVVFSYY